MHPANQSAPPGAPGGLVLPGGTADNPLAIGTSVWPPAVSLPLTPLRMASWMTMDAMRNTTAPVTVFTEVDATHLKSLHDLTKPAFESATGIPLTYLPFFARATVRALQAYPVLNSTLTLGGYQIPRHIHLGVATQAPGAVVVPVIWHAESKSIPELARDIHVLSQRARAGQTLPQEQVGQTFAITNTGRWGKTLFGTPTIKPPNVGILAFEAIVKRPVVAENDEIVARPMMYLALTGDHRALDGADMLGFMGVLKNVLENLTF